MTGNKLWSSGGTRWKIVEGIAHAVGVHPPRLHFPSSLLEVLPNSLTTRSQITGRGKLVSQNSILFIAIRLIFHDIGTRLIIIGTQCGILHSLFKNNFVNIVCGGLDRQPDNNINSMCSTTVLEWIKCF